MLFVLRAQDFASRQIRSVAGSFGVLGRQMQAYRDKGAKQVAEVQETLRRRTRGLDDALRATTQARSLDNKRMAEANARMRDELRYRNLSNAQIAARRSLLSKNAIRQAENNRVMEEARQAHKNQTTQVRRGADDQVRSIRRVTQANIDAVEAHRANAQSIVASGRRMLVTGAIMGAVGVAGIAAMGAMGSAAAEFRQQVALAQTQAEDVEVSAGRVGASIAELEQVAYDVGAAVPVPLEELSGGLYDIFSSIDVSLRGGQKLLNQFAKDAVAGQVELEDASRANIAVLNAWRREASDATDVSDTMFRLVERGIGTYGEFTQSIGRAIPATVRSGQEFETLGASMAYLTRQGLSAERAATSTARAFELLADPRVVADLEAIGVQMKDTQGNFLPMVDILEQISARWGHLPAPERAAQMMEIFSGAGYRIQARRFLDTVIPGFAEFNTEVDRMSDRAGAAQRAYNTMFAQPKSQIQLLINNLKILVYEIGENFFGVINRIASVGIGFVNWLRSIDPALVDLATGFLAVIAVALTLSGVILSMAGMFKMLHGAMLLMVPKSAITGLSRMAVQAGFTQGGLGGLLAFLTNPWVIGLAAAAIAVVGVITVLKDFDAKTVSSEDAARTLAESAGAAFADIEDLGKGADGATDSLAKFRQENKDTAQMLRELGDEAARGRLIEIGMELKMRSDLEPQEIEEWLNRLAEQADLGLDVPIRFEEINVRSTLESVMNDVREGIQSGWADQNWNNVFLIGLDSLKERLDTAADAIAGTFNITSDAQGFVQNIQFMEEAIRQSEGTDTAKAEAINHLVDQIAKMINMGDQVGNISNVNELIAKMGEEALLTTDQILQLEDALGIDLGSGLSEGERNVRNYLNTLGTFDTSGAVGNVNELGSAFAGQADDTEDATSALQDHENMLRGQVDPVFKAMNAQMDYQKSLLDVEAAEKAVANADNAEERKAAQRGLREAHLATAEAMFAQREAVVGMVDETDNLILSAEGLRRSMEEVGIPQPTIDAIMEDADLVYQILEDLAEEREIDLVMQPEKMNRIRRTLRSIINDEGEIIVTADQAKAALSRMGVAPSTIAKLGNDTGAMIDLINKVAKKWDVDVEAKVLRADRISSLESQLRSLTGRTWTVNVRNSVTTVRKTTGGVSRGGYVKHAGGWAEDSTGPTRSMFDVKPDEVPTILQKGEFVLSRRMVDQLKNVMRMHKGGYVIKRGDTLSGIAQKHMGNASQWRELYQANKGKIDNPNLIFPGQNIVIPHGHKGRGGGGGGRRRSLGRPQAGAGVYAGKARRVKQVLRAGGGSAGMERAIERVNELTEAWDKAAEAKANAARRRELVRDVRAADDAKERRQATKALKEWDHARAVAKQKESIERQLARAELIKEIRLNKEQWRFSQMSTEDQIANVRKRMKQERKWTDEWVSLLEERNRLQEQQKQDEIRRIEAIEEAISRRRDSLQSELRMVSEGGIISAGGFADIAQAQNEQLAEWHNGLLKLQQTGLSEEAIAALGLAESPQKLSDVRNLLSSSAAEIAQLNRAIADRQGLLSNILAAEQGNSIFELFKELQTASFDDGGVLKPGFTLAYNGTGRDEFVTKSAGGSTLVRVEEGAFQFNGPIDSATLPQVEQMLNDFVEDLSDEIRSR